MAEETQRERWAGERVEPILSVEEERLADDCLRIHVRGELDLSTCDQLVDRLEKALGAESHVVLDLKSCSFLDSTGIAAIIGARRRLADLTGRGLCVVSAEGAVARVLEISGLLRTDLVQDDLETALFACRQFPRTA